ncbi:hypothetical protein SADUNF_Sadunf16G0135200 [Salix dunnii]|uniref:PWI domain-containing protein n=1 Tax=Salix dunnii TaxID=1413687 RepID=A0A835MGX2_9ROSI|nr:hypothetical protein SADUNF_Sadunf16G0135200 [Salix dunnii]
MSGGFFRGTSADQDTRFSNKQAKLLKSQKFAPELDHLVDTRKVKMDVIKPWIANRVTELLGFEDEVLINFIYGLLDGKEVNGKEVQISLTGFMEKNTGKFMKELWTLLLSAGKNESGVPQQFLDAKEEETRKKQAEMDRIAKEIQKKKEKEEESRELERERLKKMDDEVEKKANNAMEPASKNMLPKGSSGHAEDEKETGKSLYKLLSGCDSRESILRYICKDHSCCGFCRTVFQDDVRCHLKGDSNTLVEWLMHCSCPIRGASNFPCLYTGKTTELPICSPMDPPFKALTTILGKLTAFKMRTVFGWAYSKGSPSRISRSVSNSRSHSGQKSRSVSRSPEARGRRSVSSDRVCRSPRRRSLTPPRRRSSYSKHRSRSPFRRRSPSPIRCRLRSPFRRRSPSPFHDRSLSPVRRRRSPTPVRRRRSPSPIRRRRSPSPMRRRRSPSPVRRRRSPSPVRHRRSPSPVRRRPPSPIRRRSPPSMRRRSPSPVRQRYQRSPSTPHHMSPPMRHRSSVISRKRSPAPLQRSPSPYGSSSPSPVQHRSPPRRSPKELRRSPIQSPGERFRSEQTLLSVLRHSSSSLRSPQRDQRDKKDSHNRLPPLSPSSERSPLLLESPPVGRKRSASEDRRSPSPYKSPARQRRDRITHDSSLSPLQQRVRKPLKDSPESSKDHEEIGHTRGGRGYNSTSSHKQPTHPSNMDKQRVPPVKFHKDEESLEGIASLQTTNSQNYPDNMDQRKKDQDLKIGKSSGRGGDQETRDPQKSPSLYKNERDRSRLNNVKDSDKRWKSETVPVTAEKVHTSNGSGALDSGSEESDKHRGEKMEKSKHKRSHQREVALDDDGSCGSEIEERKEAKRRRKEEKKLRKEEKRRRHEERRRRRAERRAEKLKLKGGDDASSSDDERVGRRESHPSDDEETESDQRKLEIELRKKALESLKAKKGTSH